MDIKEDISAIDSNVNTDKQDGLTHVVPDVDPQLEKNVVAKLDLFLTPVLFIIYLSCFIDRANIGELPIFFRQSLVIKLMFVSFGKEMSRLRGCQRPSGLRKPNFRPQFPSSSYRTSLLKSPA